MSLACGGSDSSAFLLRHGNALRPPIARFLFSLSTTMSEEDTPPVLAVRWMRPLSSSALLELPTAPVTLSTATKDWQAFTAEESAACEDAWQKMSDEEKSAAEWEDHAEDSRRSSDDIDNEDEDTVGVSIAKDKLFEVDVKSMRVSQT